MVMELFWVLFLFLIIFRGFLLELLLVVKNNMMDFLKNIIFLNCWIYFVNLFFLSVEINFIIIIYNFIFFMIKILILKLLYNIWFWYCNWDIYLLWILFFCLNLFVLCINVKFFFLNFKKGIIIFCIFLRFCFIGNKIWKSCFNFGIVIWIFFRSLSFCKVL